MAQIITPEQDKFLAFAGKSKYLREHFYFTGGTALAAFYLRHRLSEDIDLFIENAEVPLHFVTSFIKKAQKELGIENIYTEAGIKYGHHLETAVRAKALYERDKDYVVKDGEIVIVDEIQFFDQSLIGVLQSLVWQGKVVYVAGLDTDWRGRPFGPVPEVLSIATQVYRLQAECSVCSQPAVRSQRIAQSEEDIFLGTNEYEPRCLQHFFVPNLEKTNNSQISLQAIT